MKENIEEVIERLEKSINDVWFSTTYSQEDEERDLQALLSDYKRVLKENEELKHKYEKALSDLVNAEKKNEELKRLIAHKNGYTQQLEKDLFENCSNYVVSKQKVKDKIEELNKYSKEHNYINMRSEIQVLQELLEEKGE